MKPLYEKSKQDFEEKMDQLEYKTLSTWGWVLNEERMTQMRKAFDALLHLFDEGGYDAEISYKKGELVQSNGDFIIEGKRFNLDDMKKLSYILDAADNMDVYPLTNGGIRMTFGFYGLIEQEEV